MPPTHPTSAADGLDADACYLALKAHDARFDGSFFTAVRSTGIYCRPVCRVKLPRRENCSFYRHAAQAEAAGFRPCLRCRPELAPRAGGWSTEDASRILALQAARLIDEPDAWAPTLGTDVSSLPPVGARSALGRPGGGTMTPTLGTGVSSLPPVGARSALGRPGGGTDGAPVARVAARLGVSDRHLRRIFESQFGVSPLQYLQTRRLLAAKQLIADTRLPMAQVALASGFASVRRFNAAFVGHYGLNPSALRRAGFSGGKSGGGARGGAAAAEVRLGLRPPYDAEAMLGFLARRALGGVEVLGRDRAGAQFGRTLRIVQGGREFSGWLQLRFDQAREQLLLRVGESLVEVLPIVISRVRALLDLDADPMAINQALHASFPHGDGLRVPGTVDGFELALRAVLGQQITVAAARTLGSRLVQAFGEPIATPVEGLERLFPTPAAIAAASGDELGRLGIVRQRQAALLAIARETAAGRLPLHPGADVPATLAALQALPGIGDWTAQYIAMRALRWPDAFTAGDVALQKALGVDNARAAAAASQAWRPWRGYAVLRAWHAPAAAPATIPTDAAPRAARRPRTQPSITDPTLPSP